jgi:ABC-2 type transport system ATP-binding protein
VLVNGLSVEDHSLEVRRMIGYLPESCPLYSELRVNEYLKFRAALKGVPWRIVGKRVSMVKEMCGLESVGRRILGHLSKGFRQRVGIADALVSKPELLILDEPTIGLDPNQIRQVRRMIKSLAQEHTVLISTHILPEAEMICSRVLIIDGGRIVAQDTPEQLRERLYGGASFTAEILAKREEVKNVLGALKGLNGLDVESYGEWQKATVDCDPGVDLRSKVFECVALHDWKLRELHQKSRSLEDVFIALTRKGNER